MPHLGFYLPIPKKLRLNYRTKKREQRKKVSTSNRNENCFQNKNLASYVLPNQTILTGKFSISQSITLLKKH